MIAKTTSRGFTLVELLLSVSIIGMLTALSTPFYVSFQSRNGLDVSTQSLVSALRRAQAYARAVRDDSQWSIQVATNTITLYRGTTFVSRDTSEDESVMLDGVTASGLSSIAFEKVSGAPNTTGSITLANNSETRTVTINAEGMVSY